MSIHSIPAAWKTNQQTAGPGAREDRVYVDFRNVDYPDVARDTRNYIDRGDCESVTEPTLRTEVADTNSNTTFARSADYAHAGDYSFKLTKTVAAGTEGYTVLQDGVVTTDMHGFLAGETVEFLAWCYIPATGGPLAAEVTLRVQQYYAEAWNATTVDTATTLGAWHKLAGRVALNAACAAIRFEVVLASAAADTEYCYFDDFEVYRYPTFTLAREDNLIDRGNCESATYPMVLDETSAYLQNATFVRSADLSRSGSYSYKFTKTNAAGTAARVGLTDNVTTIDMHGFATGEVVEVEAWVYIPTASGIVGTTETNIRSYEYYSAVFQITNHFAVNTYDAWQRVSFTHIISSATSAFGIQFQAESTASLNEYFYVDDIRVTRHSVSGSHYLSGGYTEHLVTLPDTFTLRVKFHPTFAFDTASNQFIAAWYVSATQRFMVYYVAEDKFKMFWQDGGTVRSLASAQYDDGATYRNINQWIELVAAINLTTGTTAGSALWMNGTQDDVAWSGAIDAKVTVFNKMQLRAYAGTAGAYDIAYCELIPDYVATAADVANDFKDVKAERIWWSMDGHATGTTRVDVTPFVANVGIEKAITSWENGRSCANRSALNLINANGEFSDDQYAAYSPTLAQYNGLVTDKYLRNNNRLMVESWYGGDFDYEFVGQIREGYRRTSPIDTVSMVSCGAIDSVAMLASQRFDRAKIWENCKLSDSVECNSLLHLLAREGRPRIKQHLADNSFCSTAVTDAWAASGGTFTRNVAGPLFGTGCASLVPGAGTQYVGQFVLMLVTTKMSVGDVFTFSIRVASSGAASGANNNIAIQEHDVGGANAATTTLYDLAGGEGWVRYSVTHTITDADSDRLFCAVVADAGDTILMDGAMLTQGSATPDVFRQSSYKLDVQASAGAVSGDYADVLSWDLFGFDVDSVDYTHPWRRVEEGANLWGEVSWLCDGGLEPVYSGFDESGTFRLRSVLASGYSDPSPIETITGDTVIAPMDTSHIQAINKLVGYGNHIRKLTEQMDLWDARNASVFEVYGDGFLAETVADGNTWPNIESTEFWATYSQTQWQSQEPTESKVAEKEAVLTPWQKMWDWFIPFTHFEYNADANKWEHKWGSGK